MPIKCLNTVLLWFRIDTSLRYVLINLIGDTGANCIKRQP